MECHANLLLPKQFFLRSLLATSAEKKIFNLKTPINPQIHAYNENLVIAVTGKPIYFNLIEIIKVSHCFTE